jgi:hypothetical protein
LDEDVLGESGFDFSPREEVDFKEEKELWAFSKEASLEKKIVPEKYLLF